MAGRLIEVRQPGRRPLVVLVRDDLELGRECDGLVLADTTASRRHARIELVDGALRVSDLDSHNGTLVNGEPIVGSTPFGAGDVVSIGATDVVLFEEAVPGRPSRERSARATLEWEVPAGHRHPADSETVAGLRLPDPGT